MDGRRTLPPVFRALEELKAPVTHYKICSTLDSSPTVGSIGRAIDLAAPILGSGRWRPVGAVIVGAPPIGRYQAFGNLFAVAADGVRYRLDRHPGMRRHPVTPMDESDVARPSGPRRPTRRSGWSILPPSSPARATRR